MGYQRVIAIPPYRPSHSTTRRAASPDLTELQVASKILAPMPEPPTG
jgi:hypothetical protein